MYFFTLNCCLIQISFSQPCTVNIHIWQTYKTTGILSYVVVQPGSILWVHWPCGADDESDRDVNSKGVSGCLVYCVVYSPPTSCLFDTAGVHGKSLQEAFVAQNVSAVKRYGQIRFIGWFWSARTNPCFYLGCVRCVWCVLDPWPCCLVFQGESLAFMKWPIVFHLFYDCRGDCIVMIVQSRGSYFYGGKGCKGQG